jgi:hypothetical protein
VATSGAGAGLSRFWNQNWGISLNQGDATSDTGTSSLITEGEKKMVDYHPLRSNNWKLPESDPEPEEEQDVQQPVVVEAVYNYHEDGKSKTVALKVSLQLPQLKS